MIYLATSCYQGEDQVEAYNKLKVLQPKGIQICSGNLPNKNFRSVISDHDLFHHNFHFDRIAPSLWSENLELNFDVNGRSIHPPNKHLGLYRFEEWLEKQPDIIFEVMHPGYWLANDEEIMHYLSTGRPLAVDISHLNILVHKKRINDKTLRSVLEYDRIPEVHVSMNNGMRDSHQPATRKAFLLDWAIERSKTCNVVYEGNLRLVENVKTYMDDLMSWFV